MKKIIIFISFFFLISTNFVFASAFYDCEQEQNVLAKLVCKIIVGYQAKNIISQARTQVLSKDNASTKEITTNTESQIQDNPTQNNGGNSKYNDNNTEAVLIRLLKNTNFGGGGDQVSTVQSGQNGILYMARQAAKASLQTITAPNLEIPPDTAPRKIFKEGSCVAFGDSIAYGMSESGVLAPCISYRPDGSFAATFVKANEGKSWRVFKQYLEKVMNDPGVKVIAWELGTNDPIGSANFYKDAVRMAIAKGKIILLPVYDNDSSRNISDPVAMNLAKYNPENVKLLDYTKGVSSCKPQNLHYTASCYKKIAEYRKSQIVETLKTEVNPSS